MARKNYDEFRNGYYPNEHTQNRRPARNRQTARRRSRRSRRAFPAMYLFAALAAVVLVVAGILIVPRIMTINSAATWSIADMAGNWVATADGKQAFTAMIADNTIAINWASDDMSALYWKGTFNVPDGSEGTKTVVSDAAEENATSIFASTDAQKTFTVTKSSIEFEASAMGVTRTFTLKR